MKNKIVNWYKIDFFIIKKVENKNTYLFHKRFSVLFLSFNIFFFSAIIFLSPACFFAKGPSATEILHLLV